MKDDHPFVVVMRTWGYEDDYAYMLVTQYLETQRTLSQREMQVLALLETGNVFKVLTRWYGDQLAAVARAHLVHELKTNRQLIG